MNAFKFINSRLFIMMFLEFCIAGSWNTTLGLVLSKAGLSSIIGTAFSLLGLATILSPLIIGMIADRFVASQKIMAALHIINGFVLLLIPSQIVSGQGSAFLWLIFMVGLLFYPTISLSNSITFEHTDGAKFFPVIRVGGTISFFIIGIVIGQLGLSSSTAIFNIAGFISFVLGLYSLSLPHTPPKAKGKPISWRDLLCVDAFKLFKDRNFTIFIICTLVLIIPKSAYNAFIPVFLGALGFNNVATIMQLGTISEVVFMVLLPFFLLRLGFKYMLILSACMWIVRFGVFSFASIETSTALAIFGLLLHGVCWDFFFTTGDIYVDKKAGPQLKAQAQGLKYMLTSGIGTFVGSRLAGDMYNRTVTSKGAAAFPEWQMFWLYPVTFAAVVAIIFFFLFKNEFTNKNTNREKEELHLQSE